LARFRQAERKKRILSVESTHPNIYL